MVSKSAGSSMPVVCSQDCPLARDVGAVLPAPAVCNTKVKLEAALQKHFRFDRFRRGQLDALLPAMHGRDVFVHMATGSGKTLYVFGSTCLKLFCQGSHNQSLDWAHGATGNTDIRIYLSTDNIILKVQELTKVGVSATRVTDRSQIPDVAAGKF